MSDMFSEYLGLDITELKDLTEEKKEKNKEIAVAIVKLSEYPEWQVFSDELNRLLKECNKECEFYANNPNIAHYDSGFKRAIQIIQHFVEKQHKLIQLYAESSKTENNQA